MASSPQALLSDAPNHCRNADHLAPPRPEEPSRARQRPGPRLDGRCWGCHKLGLPGELPPRITEVGEMRGISWQRHCAQRLRSPCSSSRAHAARGEAEGHRHQKTVQPAGNSNRARPPPFTVAGEVGEGQGMAGHRLGLTLRNVKHFPNFVAPLFSK